MRGDADANIATPRRQLLDATGNRSDRTQEKCSRDRTADQREDYADDRYRDDALQGSSHFLLDERRRKAYLDYGERLPVHLNRAVDLINTVAPQRPHLRKREPSANLAGKLLEGANRKRIGGRSSARNQRPIDAVDARIDHALGECLR